MPALTMNISNFPYKTILHRALQITWRNKFLWALGFLALGYQGSNIFVNLAGPEPDMRQNDSIHALQVVVERVLEQPSHFLLLFLGGIVATVLFIAVGAIATGALVRAASMRLATSAVFRMLVLAVT